MFGHVINLNFNRQGDTHNTVIGGCFSMLIKLAMSIYVFLNFKKLVFKEADTIGLQYKSVDLDKVDPIEYANSDFMAFWVLTKSDDFGAPIYLNSFDPAYNRTVSTMIKIQILQQNSDWFNSQPHEYINYEVKQCDVKDFCLQKNIEECSEANVANFKAWAGFSLICPVHTDFMV